MEITWFPGIARVLQTSKENTTICAFVVGKFLAPVKSTICYGKYIYLFKQNSLTYFNFLRSEKHGQPNKLKYGKLKTVKCMHTSF